MTHAPREDRSRGRIEERARTLRVIVYAGIDPVTGKRVYLRGTIQGTDKAAHKRAERVLNKLLAQADKQQTATSSVKFSFALDEWMRTNEIEESTRNTYLGYINRTIVPALGDQPVNKISARMLESFYSDLRRCRARCDGKPYVEHRKTGEHDCQKAKCRAHACSPMAQSTVRQIHAIISGTLDAAERWEWIDSNPARVARKPKQKRPEPTPPTPAEAARLSEEAFRIDDDWGNPRWLAMTTGIAAASWPHCASLTSIWTRKSCGSTETGFEQGEGHQDPPAPPHRPRLGNGRPAPRTTRAGGGASCGGRCCVSGRPVRLQQCRDTRPHRAVLTERHDAPGCSARRAGA
ncbi:N-terminal phage integrase SAM-like domain-containing protein [Saccharopolyspora sp. NPDC003752]